MTKNYLVLVLGTLLTLSATAQDQELKPFKVDISLGYAMPVGTGSDGGAVFSIEPKYAITSNIAIGLRMEGAAIARFTGYDYNGNPTEADVKASASYLLTGDFYLSDKYSFRPFVGAGAGIFALGKASVNSSSESYGGGTEFGGMIRAGFEASHFRFGIECNIIPQSSFSGYDQNGDPVSNLESKNSYIGFKLGVCLGGGPRK